MFSCYSKNTSKLFKKTTLINACFWTFSGSTWNFCVAEILILVPINFAITFNLSSVISKIVKSSIHSTRLWILYLSLFSPAPKCLSLYFLLVYQVNLREVVSWKFSINLNISMSDRTHLEEVSRPEELVRHSGGDEVAVVFPHVAVVDHQLGDLSLPRVQLHCGQVGGPIFC